MPDQRELAQKLRGKKHPPFGATNKQASKYAELRKLKNRIAELEDQIERGATVREVASRPSDVRVMALRRIAEMPATLLVQMGIQHEAITLAGWLHEIEGTKVRPVY